MNNSSEPQNLTSISVHERLCSCYTCHHRRVVNGTNDAYVSELGSINIANTKAAESKKVDFKCEGESNEAPLCYNCNKNRGWQGICVDCHVDLNGRDSNGNLYPFSTIHNIRQGYYMNEECYASSRRVKKQEEPPTKYPPPSIMPVEATAEACSSVITDANIKDLFKQIQGVNFDAICPHSLPFYACMSCSH
jgi:hypothetical protein